MGAGYTDSLLICATLAALVVIICLTLVRFTPEDIREGKVAEELANQG